MDQNKISVVIPIKEDSKNLQDLLSNLKEFAFTDIHVVDSVQCDFNESLCIDAGASYAIFNWNGGFPKKRNWYLDFAKLRDWVLFLDSDERLTHEFCQELLDVNDEDFDGYYVRYNNTFLGKKLKFGDVMTKIPLFRKTIRFERIEEMGWSTFDMEIHEHPVLEKSKIGVFKSRIEHLEKTSIQKYLSKHNQYSNWESNRLASQSDLKDLRLRTRLKYSLLKSPLVGLLYFFYAYILKLGILDGWAGYYLAKLKAQYFFWIRLKYKYEARIK